MIVFQNRHIIWGAKPYCFTTYISCSESLNFDSGGEVSGMICHLVTYLVFENSRRRVNRFVICLKILLGYQMTFLTVYITYTVFWGLYGGFSLCR